MAARTVRLSILATLAIIASSPAVTRPPDTWNGLMRVKSAKMNAVYLLPKADFRTYTKVMLEPAEVAFDKGWVQDYNSSADMGGRISDSEVRQALTKSAARTDQLFSDAFQKAGYQLATAPGADVIAIKPMIVNVRVTAPDVNRSSMSNTYSYDAGQATLALEVRDSVSRQVIAVAADAEVAGDNGSALRNSVTNRGDFEDLVKNWARQTADGLGKIKAMSPIDGDGNKTP